MKKLLLIPLIVIFITSLFLSGCAEPTEPAAPVEPAKPAPVEPAPAEPEPAKPSADEPQYGGTFIIRVNRGITTMGSPADGAGYATGMLVFDTLFRLDDDENVLPWLAESYQISPDKTSITLKLREGVKFHDGTPFNAQAVKYNLEANLEANLRGSAVLGTIELYEVIDDYTLKMNLKEYDNTLLVRLASSDIGMIGSPTAMEKPATAETQAELHMVGTGPFMFDSWQRDNFIKVTRNPDYWVEGKPYLDAIEVRQIADLTVAVMGLKAGELDVITNVDPIDARQLEKEGYDIQVAGLYWVHTLIPSGNNPDSPFADKRVREALAYALDKEVMCEGIGMGFYTALYQMAMPWDPWYDSSLKPREYNLEKAKELLTAAGYPDGLNVKLISDVRARKDTLVAVQTYLLEAGFKIELDIADVARYSAITRDGWEGILSPGFPNSINYLGFLSRWRIADDYVSYYRPAGWQEKWDALTKEGDEVKRQEQFKELMKIMYDECIAIPYQGDAPLVVLQPGKVHGFNYHSNRTGAFYERESVWLSK